MVIERAQQNGDFSMMFIASSDVGGAQPGAERL
jgi:hypothetical protein